MLQDIFIEVNYIQDYLGTGRGGLAEGFGYLNNNSIQCLNHSVSFRGLVGLASGKPNNQFAAGFSAFENLFKAHI